MVWDKSLEVSGSTWWFLPNLACQVVRLRISKTSSPKTNTSIWSILNCSSQGDDELYTTNGDESLISAVSEGLPVEVPWYNYFRYPSYGAA